MLIFLLILAIVTLAIVRLNRDFYILALCRRFKTVDGSKLETKIYTVKGNTIFGNTLDILNSTPESVFAYMREKTRLAQGKSSVMYSVVAPIYNITNAEDAEEVFQSQKLITKSIIYELVRPFLGLGLLISSAELWQFRRKILTPAFHFNILQTFLEIFKEESHKFIKVLDGIGNEIVTLNEVIPAFTLNTVCETALGVKLGNVPGSDLYRKAIHDMEPFLIKRISNPLMYFDWTYRFFGDYRKQQSYVHVMHEFASKIVGKRREKFQQPKVVIGTREIDEFGKKQRFAMLDTLLDAETKGLIDHQGICDEVNTFMFEGYDTTSICLMFTLTNLAIHQDIQEKCFEEIKDLDNIDSLTVFDFNNLEYLECVIKESLRLYPSVPFVAREALTETVVNGLILPKNTQINLHIFDIMRDERHFPEPEKFDPDRFKPENTTDRHPFAFVPFSAGPRNCIGQKFAMLEVKVLLVAILKKFILLPITRMEDLIFQNGLVLRSKQDLQIKVTPRN